ncbi:MAG: hypothetical protein M0024_11035 [Nitrospiraceae bacterium]|nr:hypothetical protein [Nitrospiraceae bacterium]
MNRNSGYQGTAAIRWYAIIIAWLILCAVSPGRALAAEPYDFAVVPQFEQRKLFAIWKPVVDELQKRTGIPLRLVALVLRFQPVH